MGELKHYGIPGMIWGVRNGPPYPLGSNQKSTTEKSKTYQDKRYGNSYESKGANFIRSKANLDGMVDPGLIVLGVKALVAIGLLIAAPIISKKQTEKPVEDDNKKVEDEIKSNKEKNGKFEDIPKIIGKHSPEEDMEAVNPHFLDGPEYQSNCTMCTAAYELRRRGYDVEASTSKHGRNIVDYAKWFGYTKEEVSYNGYDKLKIAFKDMPNGARGNISSQVGPFYSGHSMSWEKIKDKIVIRDCQENTVYYNIDTILNSDASYYYMYRTDNATINEELIMDAVRPRGNK